MKNIQTTKIAIFKGKKIRKTIYNNEWRFVVADIVSVLTDTPNVKDYIRKMRIRDEELGKGWGQIVTPLSIDTVGAYNNLALMLDENNRKSEAIEALSQGIIANPENAELIMTLKIVKP